MSELFFEGVRVPKENLLGAEGDGVIHMMRNLELERLTLGAMSVGIAERCLIFFHFFFSFFFIFFFLFLFFFPYPLPLSPPKKLGVEIMVDYAKNRKAFGQPISHFGQIQRYIGEGFALTEAAKALTYNCARSVNPDVQNRIGTDAVKVDFLFLFIFLILQSMIFISLIPFSL